MKTFYYSKELKLSQKDFAVKIDLSQNAISQYLTGKRKTRYKYN